MDVVGVKLVAIFEMLPEGNWLVAHLGEVLLGLGPANLLEDAHTLNLLLLLEDLQLQLLEGLHHVLVLIGGLLANLVSVQLEGLALLVGAWLKLIF